MSIKVKSTGSSDYANCGQPPLKEGEPLVNRTRIVLAEDHTILREGLKSLLSSDEELENLIKLLRER